MPNATPTRCSFAIIGVLVISNEAANICRICGAVKKRDSAIVNCMVNLIVLFQHNIVNVRNFRTGRREREMHGDDI